jgi:phage tail-like protein
MAAAVSGSALSGSDHAAVYYPWLRIVDQIEIRKAPLIAPSGAVAGLYARTDGDRGVWKAPAGAEANLVGVKGVAYPLSGRENDSLHSLGVNCLRVFPEHGVVSWGARTLRGAGRMNSEYKYVPVRRLALFIEESLYRGIRWVVFEPNDESLWAQIRLGIDAFMNNLFRRGAFQGNTPPEAYLVRCGSDTTTREDIDRGFVNILVGFAALKPAEFVIIRIQQLAGQVQGEDPRMTESTASARRVDPYKDYRFRVKWDGRYVAGFSKVSALKRTTEVVKHRKGGNPGHRHKSPGRSGFEAITLKHGITRDTGFGEWASKACRRDLVIECYDETGRLAMTYKVSRSWVSEYTALPELDAGAMILPANDGHPVKRIQYATEVNHDKTNSSKEDDDPETVFKGIQG